MPLVLAMRGWWLVGAEGNAVLAIHLDHSMYLSFPRRAMRFLNLGLAMYALLPQYLFMRLHLLWLITMAQIHLLLQINTVKCM